MDDQQEATGQAEPSWLDRAVEALDRIRALNVVPDADVISFDLARDGVRLHVWSGGSTAPADVAARLRLTVHSERPAGTGVHHAWWGVADNGVRVTVVTHVRDEDEAVAS